MLKFTLEKKYLLPIFITICLTLFFIGILYFQLLYNKELYFVNKFSFGYDFKDFYNASSLLLSGENPYNLQRFVTPPFSSLIAIPFQPMGFSIASRVFSIGSIILFIVSLSLLIKKQTFSNEGKLILLSSVIITTGLSYPAFFLFDRGNIDFLVISLLILGISFINTRPMLSGLLIGISILLKIYPIIILIPILLEKKCKIVFYVLCIVILFSIITPSLFLFYFNNIFFTRLASFRYDENASIINLFLWVKKLFSQMDVRFFIDAKEFYFIFISYLFYIITIFLIGILDKKKVVKGDIYYLLYFPFMVAIPNLVYQYELVILIPLLIILVPLWEHSETFLQRISVLGLSVGIVFTQFQVVALEKLFNVVYPHFISSFGLFVVIISILTYKLSFWTESRKNEQNILLQDG